MLAISLAKARIFSLVAFYILILMATMGLAYQDPKFSAEDIERIQASLRESYDLLVLWQDDFVPWTPFKEAPERSHRRSRPPTFHSNHRSQRESEELAEAQVHLQHVGRPPRATGSDSLRRVAAREILNNIIARRLGVNPDIED
ncbi:hypothetical protein FA15DRAFT_672652 [Coprinopsis marcescibilis]|uniref:Uncharacterized protein n=1 Tax=Coprinopsis marcescibilis TaxID=230819 RepID=A0A5C3KLX3_COPMA|nr:hypothetical protein FA15DRAFT_672652 [Coprinopsis marcescibilis]